MRFLRNLRRNESGAAAIEFALVTPVLILFIIGIAQLGTLFMAQTGLTNAVAEGARYATIYPRPTDTQIRTRISNADFGLNPANLTTPALTHGTADSADYVEISATYTVTPDFIFFTLPPVSMTETRRAFIHKL